MNEKRKIIMRLSRNILIALISALWIFPFTLCVCFVLNFLQIQETILFDKLYPNGWSFSYIKISESALTLVSVLLAITVVFWAFLAANKLWPIKGKPKAEMKKLF